MSQSSTAVMVAFEKLPDFAIAPLLRVMNRGMDPQPDTTYGWLPLSDVEREIAVVLYQAHTLAPNPMAEGAYIYTSPKQG